MNTRPWVTPFVAGFLFTACATTTEIDRSFVGVVTHVDQSSRHVTLKEPRSDGTSREVKVIINSLTKIEGPYGPAGLNDLRVGQEYDVTARRDVDGESWSARKMTPRPSAR